jgi:hypothetical protein
VEEHIPSSRYGSQPRLITGLTSDPNVPSDENDNPRYKKPQLSRPNSSSKKARRFASNRPGVIVRTRTDDGILTGNRRPRTYIPETIIEKRQSAPEIFLFYLPVFFLLT